MINGVDINDNLFAQPQNLFIEDAIEETQVLTSGISAEFGRFSGGVVNAITKSGGDTFSGSGPRELLESGVDHRDALRGFFFRKGIRRITLIMCRGGCMKEPRRPAPNA